MKRFAAFYFLFLMVLFVFLYADTNMVSSYINERQTALTLFSIDLFLEPGQLKGIDIWIRPDYKIVINQACNGMIPILFLFAALLAYPSALWHKLIWMGAGYVTFSLVNVLRILLVVYFVEQKEGQGNFYWSHDLLGNALLMAVGLGLFIAFIKTSKSLEAA